LPDAPAAAFRAAADVEDLTFFRPGLLRASADVRAGLVLLAVIGFCLP
jgi:hypothetical protein